jgi:hypothetical protein
MLSDRFSIRQTNGTLNLNFKVGKKGERNMLYPMTALLIGDSEFLERLKL